MNELSLFSGAGGGLLGTLLLGWTPVGYVEIDDYCQRVIAARIADGILPDAPIFGDVRAFIGDGFAASYTGMVDVVTGGFPCQPFSNAGKRLGANDNRNMWPATIECIRVVRPRYTFLENVPGLLTSGYFGKVLGDMAESGYSVRWRVLSAAELGAPHKRDRLWIMGHSEEFGRDEKQSTQPGQYNQRSIEARGSSGAMAYSDSERESQSQRIEQEERGRPGDGSEPLCDATSAGLPDGRNEPLGRGAQRDKKLQSQRSDWWAVEPDVGRVAHGVAHRVDRLTALGNGQVPAVVAAAWKFLYEEGAMDL